MMRFFLTVFLTAVFTVSNAQKFKMDQLEQLLNASMDEAEENLFLQGYSFLSNKNLPDSAGVIYNFSNRKKTIGTAKSVRKGIYFKEPVKSYVEYITYDRNEFEAFRKSMIGSQFIREDRSISEQSTFTRGNLRVNFKITTDEYENISFEVKLGHLKAIVEKAPKKITLKNILKQHP